MSLNRLLKLVLKKAFSGDTYKKKAYKDPQLDTSRTR